MTEVLVPLRKIEAGTQVQVSMFKKEKRPDKLAGVYERILKIDFRRKDIAKSLKILHASQFFKYRSCPGTSTNETSVPLGSVVQANPRSIVRPRRFSSAHRSGSRPVRRCIKLDLPWST